MTLQKPLKDDALYVCRIFLLLLFWQGLLGVTYWVVMGLLNVVASILLWPLGGVGRGEEDEEDDGKEKDKAD